MTAAIQSDQLPDLPYPGIEPFNYARRKVFFARDKEARSLMQLIAMYRGVLLYSDSGTGKSSLVNAGLIPLAVDRGFQPERIRVQPRRGEEIIVERLSERVDDKRPFLPSIFASDEQHERVVVSVEEFEKTLRQPELAVRPLLIFDQFEEWITLFEEGFSGEAAEEARAAKENIRKSIVSLINDRQLRVKILIVLREDYLAKLDPLFERCRSLPDQYLRLTALSGDQVYRTIRGPFEEHPGRYRVEVGPALAKKIREQFEQRSEGADVHLTEVQIVCRSLFEAGIRGQKIDQHFTDEGGVQGILERYLELALESLNIDQQEPAVALLTRMLTSAGTRNVISEDDLLNRVENEDRIPRELLGKILQSLEKEAKLIRRERRREVYYYEIASEFLVGWIRRKAQERQRLVELRKLEEARRAEEQRREIKAQRARADEAQQRADEQTRIARRFRRLTAALVVMVVIAIVAAVSAYQQRMVAEKALVKAEEQKKKAQSLSKVIIRDNYSQTATATDGSVTKSPDQASYNNGETVTLEAVANKGSTSNESLFGPQDISKLHADADNGDAQASYYLSQRYFVGAGVDVDKEKAIKYLEKSAVAGFPPAQNELGVWLQKEEYPGGIDLERSFEWLKKAADNKDAAGTYHFGVLYLNGIYVDPDDKKAAHWIKKAAELGYSTAQASLAQMYAAAQGLPKDLELARYWYSKAANQGNIRAKGELGIYLVTGRGGEKDFGKGFKLLKEAAESNDKDAQYNLAVIYRQGMGGIEIDNESSFEWLKRSANLGHVSAQTLLGASYKVGIGTRIDIYKAEEWTTLAAEAGDAQAQYNMAILQVDKNNFHDAIKWVRLSAEQGYEPAIELLEKLGY